MNWYLGCWKKYIVFLVFLCSDSKPGANRFGANPKNA